MALTAIRRVVRSLPGGETLDARLRDAHWRRLGRPVIERYMAENTVRKLQIGSGSNLLPGWLNADLYPGSHETLRLDATQRFPFADAVFDRIFSEHMIEHIGHAEGRFMLRECFRVLRPGGRIRITTPDLQFLVDLYRLDKTPLQDAYIAWSAATHVRTDIHTDTMVINNFVRDWGHRFIYDRKTLEQSLAAAGFVGIEPAALGESADPLFRGLEFESRLPDGFLRLESQTLEAQKP
jgi:predicted SAM-dependent methyltransferase